MSRKRRVNMGPARELKDFVDRIVATEIELKRVTGDLKEDIASIYEEADDKGYDPRALRIAVRRRHESPQARAKRQETEALADLYSAAIGDLFGKPLDDLTRRRLDDQMRRQNGPADKADEPQTELPAEAVEPATPPETAEAVHEKGKQARRDGLRIVDNPYHSSSPLRAAWDEGWCEEDGSDGMEVPAAWKRTADKKPDDAPDKKPDDPPPPAPPPDGDEPRPQA